MWNKRVSPPATQKASGDDYVSHEEYAVKCRFVSSVGVFLRFSDLKHSVASPSTAVCWGTTEHEWQHRKSKPSRGYQHAQEEDGLQGLAVTNCTMTSPVNSM